MVRIGQMRVRGGAFVTALPIPQLQRMFGGVSLTGNKHIDLMFQTLEPKLKRKALRQGTRAAAKVVLEKAKSRVPVDTGNLLRTMKVRSAQRDPTTRRPIKRGEVGHAVTHVAPKGEYGRGSLDPFYSQFPEYGTEVQDAQRYLRSSLYDSAIQLVRENQKTLMRQIPIIAREARYGQTVSTAFGRVFKEDLLQ